MLVVAASTLAVGVATPLQEGVLLPAEDAQTLKGHMPLCLVQHDDRTDTELSNERSLVNLNQAVCERDSGCRFVFTRQHFDSKVEPHWQKLLAVRAALDAGCQHAVWLDSDVALHTSKPLQLLGSFRGRPVFANADPPASLTPRFFSGDPSNAQTAAMNAGVFGVAHTARGRALLDAWIGLYPAHLWSVQRKARESDGTVSKSDCLITRPEPLAAPVSRFAKFRTLLFGSEVKGAADDAAAAPSASAAAEPPSAAAADNVEAATASAASADAADGGDAGAAAATTGASSSSPKTAAEKALAATEAKLRKAEAHPAKAVTTLSLSPAIHIGCQEGVATYSFHDTWTCRGDPACDIWANSDAFEQGSFAQHLLASPTWSTHITMADAGRHNAPCASFTAAESRKAIACHFLAEYKDEIQSYVASRTMAAGNSADHAEVAIAPAEAPDDDRLATVAPMARILAERVSPYLTLRTSPDTPLAPQYTTLCHVGGAGDGVLAQQLAQRLRLPQAVAFDAAATPDAADAKVRSFNGRTVPMADGACAVTAFAYYLHRAEAAHVTPQLLREAARVTDGFVLIAEDREGRTVKEHARNARVDPHGTFRSPSEWNQLLADAGLHVLASGVMFDMQSPQIYLIARPATNSTGSSTGA